jgi:hypothetical protein
VGAVIATAIVMIAVASMSFTLGVPSASTSSITSNRLVEAPTFFFPSTGFGGYSSTGKMHQISASWRVPGILSNSKPGVAATWIGAQTTFNDDFIQVGVNEFSFKFGAPNYQLFWSDTAENFHPHILGSVQAGELMEASMTQNASGWLLRLRNKSKTLSVAKQVNYSAGVSFSVGEWIQEDPAPGEVTSHDTPYPNIANPDFQKLEIDGRAPELSRRNGQVLIASSGAIRVPTLVQHDSFTFKAPKGTALQYLTDARRLDAGVSVFDAAQVSWQTTPTRKRRDDVLDLIGVLKSNVGVFKSQSWPKGTGGLIAKLDTLTSEQISEFQAWSKTDMKLDAPPYSKFLSSIPEHDVLVDKIRASLNLPPLE